MHTDKPIYIQCGPDFADFLADSWRAKFYIICGVVIGAIAGLVFMSAAQPHYKAHMIIGPAGRDAAIDMRRFPGDDPAAAQYQGRAESDAGIEDFIRFETLLRGARVADVVMQDSHAMRILHDTRRFSGSSPIVSPHAGAAEISRFLQKHIRVEPVGASALRRVVFLHPRKEDALYLLERLAVITDIMMREDAVSRMAAREESLRGILAQTRNPDHRRALTVLLMEQEHRRIVTDIEEPYAAMVIEPPNAPDIPAWPRRVFVWPVALVLGGFGGFLVFRISGGIKVRRS